ncbi:hypothetical protein [Celeribacter sp. HF31]|uniref:hypothetical protein n=1 Tax=Celeribacter sp. HF31 TaxID=2721558 RepID=UPI00143180B9|nr:hypothetical protein [Celeribacter sp. HF31]
MSVSRDDLRLWVFEALKALGGKAYLIDVADHIWTHHEADLRTNRTRLLKWQYEMRWGATQLRKQGYMKENTTSEPWELTAKGMGAASL